jgi:poly(3-hydroxybutyrate) depolymerase
MGFVPESYDGTEEYGLFVWVNPGDGPWVDPSWIEVLRKRKLIMVSALNSGNEKFVWRRMGLALDAVCGVKTSYRINQQRVYIGGFSGGGRVASTIAMHYPDVFVGGYYQGGVNYFEPVTVEAEPEDKVFPAAYGAPDPKFLHPAKTQTRHVLMAGIDCFNREHSKAVAERMQSTSKFKHVLFQEVQGLAHAPTPKDVFDRGLGFLDGESAVEK